MIIGTVKFFNADEGYGFIAPESGGGDAFVHITTVERAGMRTRRISACPTRWKRISGARHRQPTFSLPEGRPGGFSRPHANFIVMCLEVGTLRHCPLQPGLQISADFWRRNLLDQK